MTLSNEEKFLSFLARWKSVSDISKLPGSTWRNVAEYTVDTPSVFTKEFLKAYKSLETYDYFVAGHFLNGDCHPTTKGTHSFFFFFLFFF